MGGIIGVILETILGMLNMAIKIAGMMLSMLAFWVLTVLGISYGIYKLAGNKPSERAISFKKKPKPLKSGPASGLGRLTCPHCGEPLHEDDVICPGCYQDLQTNCPICGEIVDINWDFCPRCGKTVHKLTS